MKPIKLTICLPSFDRNHGDLPKLTNDFKKVWSEVTEVFSEISLDTTIGQIKINIEWDEVVKNTIY
ncbi:hypothetical protein KZX50_19775 [Bacillus infantis]|uniref:hypothetical protein n=1 Tax=Bacillus infantis TaxID=324767 RepID=UPI00200381A9|nr:hypothetical protein [Bacillus infantis]MCK6207685.1 hypothetical protein [Bacillus infantis]